MSPRLARALAPISMSAITITEISRGIPINNVRDCRGVGFVTRGHPESVSKGTSMLRSSFTGLRYRLDVVPRRLRAAQEEDCCQVPARHKPSAMIRSPALQLVLRRLE